MAPMLEDGKFNIWKALTENESRLAHKDFKETYRVSPPSNKLMVSRLSKLNIKTTIQNKGKIHFALDNIDVDQVINKEGNPMFWKSITASELRYVKRHWDEFSAHIVFYREGEALATAPWEIHETTGAGHAAFQRPRPPARRPRLKS